MATIRIAVWLLGALIAFGHRLPGKHTLEQERIVSIAQSQIGVREKGCANCGPSVKRYLEATKLPEGHAWCAAFVSWVFKQAGHKQPGSAWSPDLFPAARRITTPKPAHVLGIYFPSLKRIAHCGIVESATGDWVISIEGNTNASGGREGDGVYRKRRHIKTIYTYANWLKK